MNFEKPSVSPESEELVRITWYDRKTIERGYSSKTMSRFDAEQFLAEDHSDYPDRVYGIHIEDEEEMEEESVVSDRY